MGTAAHLRSKPDQTVHDLGPTASVHLGARGLRLDGHAKLAPQAGAKVLALGSNGPEVRTARACQRTSNRYYGAEPCLRTNTAARSAARFSSRSSTSLNMKLPTCVARSAAVKQLSTSRRSSSRRLPRRARQLVVRSINIVTNVQYI